MSFGDMVVVATSLVAVGLIIYFVLRFAKAKDKTQRAGIKRMITFTLAGLLIVVAGASIMNAWNPITAEARSEAAQRNASNYALAESVFEFGSSPIVLTLCYKDIPVIKAIEWDITASPPELFLIKINRVNGQNLLIYAGIPPKTAYIVNITATVMSGNSPLVRVPLTVEILNSVMLG